MSSRTTRVAMSWYSFAMQCPALACTMPGTVIRLCYAVSCPGIRLCYAMSGTGIRLSFIVS
eukprot:2660108-Rhodomonas_salina.1